MDLEQPGLRVDTLLGFLPSAAERRIGNVTGTSQQEASELRTAQSCREDANGSAARVCHGGKRVEQHRARFLEAERHDVRRAFRENRFGRENPGYFIAGG